METNEMFCLKNSLDIKTKHILPCFFLTWIDLFPTNQQLQPSICLKKSRNQMNNNKLISQDKIRLDS